MKRLLLILSLLALALPAYAVTTVPTDVDGVTTSTVITDSATEGDPAKIASGAAVKAAKDAADAKLSPTGSGAGLTGITAAQVGAGWSRPGAYTSPTGATSLYIYDSNTGSDYKGRMVDYQGTWQPPVGGWRSYDRSSIDTVGLSDRGGKTATQLWETFTAHKFIAGVTDSTLAGSHYHNLQLSATIPAGLSNGGGAGGAPDGNGVPTDPDYQEVLGLGAISRVLSPGHYASAVEVGTADNDGAGTVADATLKSVLVTTSKQSPTNNPLNPTIGIESYATPDSQTGTYAPDKAFRATGAWKVGFDFSGGTFTQDAIRLDPAQTIGDGNNSYTLADLISGSGATISDAAYGAGWDGDTTTAPSKNAVYDKLEAMSAASTPAAGDTGEIQFNNGDAFAAYSGLKWNDTSKRLTVGNSTATDANAKLGIVTDENTTDINIWHYYSTGGPTIQGKSAGFAIAGSPTPVTASKLLFGFTGQGYGDTTFKTGGFARLYAADTFSDTSSPAYWSFATTPTGTTSAVERLFIGTAGGVQIGGTYSVGADPGAGNLSVSGSITAAGVPVLGTTVELMDVSSAADSFTFPALTGRVAPVVILMIGTTDATKTATLTAPADGGLTIQVSGGSHTAAANGSVVYDNATPMPSGAQVTCYPRTSGTVQWRCIRATGQ